MNDSILLTFNPGSSTLKLGLFDVRHGQSPSRLGMGVIDLLHRPLTLRITDGSGQTDLPMKAEVTEDLHQAIEEALHSLGQHFSVRDLVAVGHRVVHGGDRFHGPVMIDDAIVQAIESLVPLAPLHQPQSLRLIRAIRHLRPGLPQVASFDTAFHCTLPDRVRRFALPRAMFDQGIKQYGFHGLSYQFITGRLTELAPGIAGRRVLMAHLGSGASLCGVVAGKSQDTTMSFSTLDGIPMGTRSGALDPGVLIHLIKTLGMSIHEVEDLLYHRSGLLGLSGISADSRELIDHAAPQAHEALDVYAFRIARQAAAVINTLQGLDGIVFTAGVGEHQPWVRATVCAHLRWLGVEIDPQKNAANALQINAPASKVAVYVIPTDEEQVIAQEACSVLHAASCA